MPEMTISQLAALDVKSYSTELKLRMSSDEAWSPLLDPSLVERTRSVLTRMIESIDAQKVRVTKEGTGSAKWFRGVDVLRKYALARLNTMPPQVGSGMSGSKEAKAWRLFSAKLAEELDAIDPGALDAIHTPYGGMTASEWLAARKEKQEAGK